jgi:prophage tail gpP-like protein
MSADIKARVRVFSGSGDFPPTTMTIDRDDRSTYGGMFPCKEWSVEDNMLNVADTASVLIANPEGIHSGKFRLGQRIEFDESDPDVANGAWVRHLTGRIVRIESTSDINGGSSILLTAMDLGWHLTSCDAVPLTKTEHGTILDLIKKLVHPSWGFPGTETSGPDITDNVLNKRLKQGRAGVTRAFAPHLGGVLPFFQVEPGEKPFDVLRRYLQREGLLLNVGAKGQIVLFRPDYRDDTKYDGIEYHEGIDPRRHRNNVIGRTSLLESLDGIYSASECWSTVVIPPSVQDTDNPNAAYRKTRYTLPTNPLPFDRLSVFTDTEAINPTTRKNRAIWHLQMDAFNSWEYTAEVRGHSQGGRFLVSDTMIPVNDSLHGVNGTYYIQSVRRSLTIREGARSRLTLRKPLLDPELQEQVGSGAKAALK